MPTDEVKNPNTPDQGAKTPATKEPTPEEFLKRINQIGEEMGFGLVATLEPYLQDNGAYSIKTKINIVKLEKKK